MNEFYQLLTNPAHWAFEILLMVLFDGLIVGLCWPFARKHWQHHVARDQRDQIYKWSISPAGLKARNVDLQYKIAEATGFITPPLFGCEKCEGEQVHLDTSVVLCKECGHVIVPPKPEWTSWRYFG